jgi:hypothetical protein
VSFFPRQTVEWHLQEPRAFRRLSLSIVEMAIVTGVLLHVYRAYVLTHGANGWLFFGGSLALGMLFLLFMATAHLANFPIQRWTWRAPLFALIECGAEMATSLLLILLGREPLGSTRAEWHDWASMAMGTVATRGLLIIVWALLLAGIVQIVRRTLAGAVEEERV